MEKSITKCMNHWALLALLVFTMGILPEVTHAKRPTKSSQRLQKTVTKRIKKKASKIELDAGIIRGRRMRPKIFLEFHSTSAPVDAVVFKRQDFNDYYYEDTRVRLKYIHGKN